jgi:hypothetical protein
MDLDPQHSGFATPWFAIFKKIYVRFFWKLKNSSPFLTLTVANPFWHTVLPIRDIWYGSEFLDSSGCGSWC